MKSKQDLLKMLFARLSEIQSGTVNGDLLTMLKIELSLLYDILGNDTPSEFWEQIESAIK